MVLIVFFLSSRIDELKYNYNKWIRTESPIFFKEGIPQKHLRGQRPPEFLDKITPDSLSREGLQLGAIDAFLKFSSGRFSSCEGEVFLICLPRDHLFLNSWRNECQGHSKRWCQPLETLGLNSDSRLPL